MAAVSSRRDTGYVDNWQTGKTVTECNLHMLTTEDCSDATFHVGSEKHVVRAHRYVLISRSCVFHAMFCGPLAEQGEITIPDIEPKIFKEFLRYIYTGDATVTAESVTGLLYTSRKYAVEGLERRCTAFLEKFLSEKNVCQILEQCHSYGDPDLEQKALKILTEAGEKVTKSPGFLDLCSGCLGKFLKSENLRVKEEDVFEATLSWVKGKCGGEGVPVNHKNIQRLLGDLRYEIRFAAMPQCLLVTEVGPSEMLSDSERVRIMDKHLIDSVDISPFKCVPRKRLSQSKPFTRQAVKRFQGIHAATDGYFVGGMHAISFLVSRKILLEGCQLFDTRHHKVSVKVKDARGTVMCEPLSKTTVHPSSGELESDILFPSPVLLEAGSPYTLSVAINVHICQMFWGIRGQRSVHVDGVDFIFSDSPESMVGTSVSQGQIPGLIFRRVD